MVEQKKDLEFQEMIDVAYQETSSSLINILMNKYKLMDHFNALRRYLLLVQGDFIRHAMDLMEWDFCSTCIFCFCFFFHIILGLLPRGELNKSATKLVLHNLQRLLDKAISETNAQFQPPYILKCLDTRLLTVC